MLEKVHHINLLVRDLDAAVDRYQRTLGVAGMIRAELPERGVRTARFAVGESWIVLVQPTDPDGVPGRHLATHGEGLFLLSFQVASLDAAVAELDSGEEGGLLAGSPRAGLEDWQVVDLAPEKFFGALLQLTEDTAGGAAH